MNTEPLHFYAYDYAGLIAEFALRYGKGEYHAGAMFRQIYRHGKVDLDSLPEFDANPSLKAKINADLNIALPELVGRSGDGVTYKFLLKIAEKYESESVIIPMRHYKSICVSSQIGCKMGCNFCETAQMGFLRHLSAEEIVAQVATARFILNEPVENIVFMGMGEPMDNLDEVLQAIRIVSDQRGLNIAKSNITISTVGHLQGIQRLAELAADLSPKGFSRVRLAISLNAPNDEIRSQIMPVNRVTPMAELKKTLQAYPLKHKDDFFFMEYVLIPGVNDAPEHALQVAEYLRDLRACVNLIPYNPRLDSPYEPATREQVEVFFHTLMKAGQYCRVRGTKGQEAMAACGQLGNRALKRHKAA